MTTFTLRVEESQTAQIKYMYRLLINIYYTYLSSIYYFDAVEVKVQLEKRAK